MARIAGVDLPKGKRIVVGVDEAHPARGVLLAFDVAFLFEDLEELEDPTARPHLERLADVLERRRLAVVAHVRADEFVGLVLPFGQACFHGGIKQDYMCAEQDRPKVRKVKLFSPVYLSR